MGAPTFPLMDVLVNLTQAQNAADARVRQSTEETFKAQQNTIEAQNNTIKALNERIVQLMKQLDDKNKELDQQAKNFEAQKQAKDAVIVAEKNRIKALVAPAKAACDQIDTHAVPLSKTDNRDFYKRNMSPWTRDRYLELDAAQRQEGNFYVTQVKMIRNQLDQVDKYLEHIK